MAKLASSLPPSTQDKEQFLRELRESEKQFPGPPGSCVSSYAIDQGGEGDAARAFEVYECKLEDNEPAQKLHANLQTTALWFIEGTYDAAGAMNDHVRGPVTPASAVQ